MLAKPQCSTCRVEMILGFIPEATAGGVFVTVWHPGDPTQSKKNWRERLASPAGVRYANEEVLAVDAYRCPSCGKIELYALGAPHEGHSL